MKEPYSLTAQQGLSFKTVKRKEPHHRKPIYGKPTDDITSTLASIARQEKETEEIQNNENAKGIKADL